MLSRERKAELVEAYRDTARRLRDFWAQDSGTSIHLVAADNLDDAAGFIEAMPEEACGEAEGWRDIASAPKSPDDLSETRDFLGWCPDPDAPNGGDRRVVWWETHMNDGRGCWYGDRDMIEHPTHWRPLPAPPLAASPTGVGEDA